MLLPVNWLKKIWAFVLILLICSACRHSDYAVISEEDFASPDNSLIARVIVETYFNTTGNEKRVTLRTKGERASKATLVDGFGPGEEVRVRWNGSTNLVVRTHSFTPRLGPPRKGKEIRGVTITFEAIPESEARGENGYEHMNRGQ
jgi:hypothetical protein